MYMDNREEININNLTNYIYEMSPSDSSIEILIKNENKEFSGDIRINSLNFNKKFSSKGNSLKEIIIDLKQQFNKEISNWRKERNL